MICEVERMESIGNNTNETKERRVSRLTYDLPVLHASVEISQEELAHQIGGSRQTYNAIETGKKKMTWTVFLALIAYFQNHERTNGIISTMNDLSSDIKCIFS